MVGGLVPEDIAGEIADVAVHQFAIGGGYHESLAGEGDGMGLSLPQVGQPKGGTLLTGEQGAGFVQIHTGQRGAVHSGDDVTGQEPSRLGGGVGNDPVHQQPAVGQGERQPCPHLLDVGEGGIEGGQFFGGEIFGVGVAQGLQYTGYGGLFPYRLGQGINIKGIQQPDGLIGGQGLGHGGE